MTRNEILLVRPDEFNAGSRPWLSNSSSTQLLSPHLLDFITCVFVCEITSHGISCYFQLIQSNAFWIYFVKLFTRKSFTNNHLSFDANDTAHSRTLSCR